MNISIKNLGIVKSAEIELNGLTVLTGYNDTGKSFIGKVIYGIIQTISKFDEDYIKKRHPFYTVKFSKIEEEILPILKTNIDTFKIFKNKMYFILYEFNFDTLNEKGINLEKEIEDMRKWVIKLINEDNANNINKKSILNNINKLFDDIVIYNESEPAINEKCEMYFDNVVIRRLFDREICNKNSDDKLEIIIKDDKNIFVEIEVDKNITTKFIYNNKIEFNNSFLIETPTIIQLEKIFYADSHFQGSPREFSVGVLSDMIPLHYKQFLLYLREREVFSYSEEKEETDKIADEISKIINGNFKYDISENQEKIVLNRGNNVIKSFNVANGIKAFGLLQLLLKAGFSKNQILIVDEPEVHLHPEYEIKYAEIICKLVQQGYTIIVSTHSTYIVQAISHHSKELEIEDKVKFYFGEKKKQDIASSFKDVTDDINPIFTAFAVPMEKIYLS